MAIVTRALSAIQLIPTARMGRMFLLKKQTD
jgi:hypothetical protein